MGKRDEHSSAPPPSEACEREASATDDRSESLDAAAEAVRIAEEQLQRVREAYGRVREEAAERMEQIRDMRVGDVVDGVLDIVKKHPGPGVLIAVLVGFFFGRLFRR